MKRSRALFIAGAALAALCLIPPIQAQLPAFPGADGAARFVSGGRGGIVYHVTRLDGLLSDPTGSIEGTFWYGINDANFPANTPRTIVFDVAGTIHMGLPDTETWTSGGNAWTSESRKGISTDNLTIAGQSAPGPVIFMGGTLKPQGDNMIFRNITIAAGYGMKSFWEPDDPTPPSPGTLPTSYTMDAMDISGQNILIDHVDAFFGSDESISWNELAENVTVQYGNHALAQNYNSHSYGHLLQADTGHKMSFLNNLDAHVRGRLPRVGSEEGTGALNDFRNNVFYNWLGTAGGGADGQYSYNNFINNFYLAGNGGDSSWQATQSGGTGIFNGQNSAYTKLLPRGNLKDTNKDGDPDDTSSADADFSNIVLTGLVHGYDIGVTLPAKQALTNVLRHVGSRWWERDYDIALGNTGAVDTLGERLVHDVIAGTGRIQAWADDPFDNDPNEGVEWRALWSLRPDPNGVAPFSHPPGWDTDGDGMPDPWETEHGLDPAVANNNADFDLDGYTDLEEYLNEIAAWPAPGEIRFEGTTNSRYAMIQNWRVHGASITGIPFNPVPVPTSSPWQPSRYDTALISNATATVDAPGQHAGTLRVRDGGILQVSNGWLRVADTLEIGASGPATVQLTGGHLRAGLLSKGPSGVFSFTGGILSAGTIAFDLLNQGGTIAPGASPGQTVVQGNLMLQAGSLLDFELGAPNPNDSDGLVVQGDLTLGGALNVTDLNGFGVGTYTLISYTGSLSGSLALGSMPAGFGYGIDTSVPNEVRLVVLPAPLAFQSIHRQGDDLILSGTGPTNEVFHLLKADELFLPLSLWTPEQTNLLDANGQFTITNNQGAAQPRGYYRLRLP